MQRTGAVSRHLIYGKIKTGWGKIAPSELGAATGRGGALPWLRSKV
jgi:hypothetical protein